MTTSLSQLLKFWWIGLPKRKVFLATTVFRDIAEHPKVSDVTKTRIKNLYEKLTQVANITQYQGRFPSDQELEDAILTQGAEIIGCHLSHNISKALLEKSHVIAVATSTAGYNHIGIVDKDDILISHTPGVLHRTVADFTISLILCTLRNLITLNNFLWAGLWTPEEKWDLDQNLSWTIDNLVVGIVGMGEIGVEVTRKLYPWGIKILYYDVNRKTDIEKLFPGIQFVPTIEEIFRQADVISLHLPLFPATTHIIGEKYLRLMKPGALLVNTARGPILDMEILLSLLENNQISINLAFDVYEPEPISPNQLARFKKVLAIQPDLRFTFIPHNASADADTRGEMAIMELEDLIAFATATSVQDLEKVRLIPPHRRRVDAGKMQNFRINQWFKSGK